VKIVRVALDLPLDETFDFRIGETTPAIGSLVVVPFGTRRKVGVVVARAARSHVPAERLKTIAEVVEDVLPLSQADLALAHFCARYYQRGVGEVLAASLPPRLRQVRAARSRGRSLAPAVGTEGSPALHPLTGPTRRRPSDEVREGFDRFHPVLLQGVTGSGKTEVYLHLIAETLRRGRQALLLVPEIALTPQLENQVRSRFPGATVVAAHSNLAEGERARAWLATQAGAAHVVLGTRLAVLTPFARLGPDRGR
jgi:primosomal protein N' (replication factor Y)